MIIIALYSHISQFYPVVWMAWNSYPNCGQMLVKKKKKHYVYACSKAWFYCFKWLFLGYLA